MRGRRSTTGGTRPCTASSRRGAEARGRGPAARGGGWQASGADGAGPRLRELLRLAGTLPDADGWRASGIAAAGYVCVALPVALAGDLLGAPAGAPGARELLVPFVAPALLEEALFRGVLLPPRGARAPRWPWWVGSLAAYVAAHPLVAAVARPNARPVFDAPAFLAEALLLGAAATYLRERSGSLVPPVLLHGAVVAAWLVFGGAERLGVR